MPFRNEKSDMSNHLTTPGASTPLVSRRSIIKRGSVIAAAGAAVMLHGQPLNAVAGKADREFRLDVAMDGTTLVFNRTAGSDPGAPVVAGDSFIVRGRIFPGGVADQGLDGPHHEGSIGTWICFGTMFFSFEDIMNGAAPQVVTTQYFLLDSGDGLITDGMEGGIYTLRAVTGGYGRYRTARGQVGEHEVGVNSTLRQITPEIAIPTPNLRFDFNLEP